MISYFILYWGDRVSEDAKASHELNNQDRIYISKIGTLFARKRWDG